MNNLFKSYEDLVVPHTSRIQSIHIMMRKLHALMAVVKSGFDMEVLRGDRLSLAPSDRLPLSLALPNDKAAGVNLPRISFQE
jgi:hypothetical protein